MAIAAAGGIEHVVRAIAGHLRDGDVQAAGCAVLGVLAHDCTGEQRVEVPSGVRKCRTLWMRLGCVLSTVNGTPP